MSERSSRRGLKRPRRHATECSSSMKRCGGQTLERLTSLRPPRYISRRQRRDGSRRPSDGASSALSTVCSRLCSRLSRDHLLPSGGDQTSRSRDHLLPSGGDQTSRKVTSRRPHRALPAAPLVATRRERSGSRRPLGDPPRRPRSLSQQQRGHLPGMSSGVPVASRRHTRSTRGLEGRRLPRPRRFRHGSITLRWFVIGDR